MLFRSCRTSPTQPLARAKVQDDTVNLVRLSSPQLSRKWSASWAVARERRRPLTRQPLAWFWTLARRREDQASSRGGLQFGLQFTAVRCRRQLNTDHRAARRFLLTVATLSKIIGVVLSSRRVKKGPGRRPQSAKRQRFVELRERGWSILAAAREAGVPGPRGTTGRAVTRLTARSGGRVCARAGAAGRASDQRAVPVAGRADRDR